MDLPETFRPADPAELVELIAGAAASSTPLEVISGGSKRDIGKPDRAAAIVDMAAFFGVVDYEPSELVLTLRPSTPLAEVQALLDAHGQMFAFEPWDHGPLFGSASGTATIGGIVAAGVAGPRRVSAGGARDHLLGFAAISGRAEAFKAGGKVVKNVTGYDLSKVIAGSWGQLAVMTELTLKVLPKPRFSATYTMPSLSVESAIAAMSKAMGSTCSPTAAAHIPASASAQAQTLLRLEGIEQSVAVRARQLGQILSDVGAFVPLEQDVATALWRDVGEARLLGNAEAVWRVHIAPSRAAAFAHALAPTDSQWCLDWAGAQAWVGARSDVDVRALASACGGHAILVRGPKDLRHSIPIRHPETPALSALTQRVRQAFDPAGILSPSRFG